MPNQSLPDLPTAYFDLALLGPDSTLTTKALRQYNVPEKVAELTHVVHLKAGGYVVAGHAKTRGIDESRRFFVARLGSNGAVLWAKTTTFATLSEVHRISLCPCADGSEDILMVCGHGTMVFMSSDGVPKWIASTFDLVATGSSGRIINDACMLKDGTIRAVVDGDESALGEGHDYCGTWVMAFNAENGTLLPGAHHLVPEIHRGRACIISDDDGGYILVGEERGEKPRVVAARFDRNDQLVWRTALATETVDPMPAFLCWGIFRIAKKNDGNFLISAVLNGGSESGSPSFIFDMSPAGELIAAWVNWNRMLDALPLENGATFIRTGMICALWLSDINADPLWEVSLSEGTVVKDIARGDHGSLAIVVTTSLTLIDRATYLITIGLDGRMTVGPLDGLLEWKPQPDAWQAAGLPDNHPFVKMVQGNVQLDVFKSTSDGLALYPLKPQPEKFELDAIVENTPPQAPCTGTASFEVSPLDLHQNPIWFAGEGSAGRMEEWMCYKQPPNGEVHMITLAQVGDAVRSMDWVSGLQFMEIDGSRLRWKVLHEEAKITATTDDMGTLEIPKPQGVPPLFNDTPLNLTVGGYIMHLHAPSLELSGIACFNHVTGIGTNLQERKWVSALFMDLLHRSPDLRGIAYWVARRNDGASLSEVADGFLYCEEYCVAIVAGLYRSLLERGPDEKGLRFWTDKLKNRTALQDVIVGFCSSDEYRAEHHSPVAFVDSLYDHLLGRQPDALGMLMYVNLLRQGRKPEDVVQRFLQSREYGVSQVNKIWVSLLGRDARADELGLRVRQLMRGDAIQALEHSVLIGPEYRARALRR